MRAAKPPTNSVVVVAATYHAKNMINPARWLLTFGCLDKDAITVLYQYRDDDGGDKAEHDQLIVVFIDVAM